jgi:hypothetical protein
MSPRPFGSEERPDDAEAEGFRQRKLEAAGLEDRERAGGIAAGEQGRLSALRTEMRGFWAGKMDQAARFGHNAAAGPAPVQAKRAADAREGPRGRENRTGLPDGLKAGVEQLAGMSLNDVKVHYNSSRPARIQARAYTQGTEIHVGPGQEEHLAHEAWHVVQQKQGRVRATMKMRGQGVNDDTALEQEADVMAGRAGREGQALASAPIPQAGPAPAAGPAVLQARWIYVEGSGFPGQYYWEGRGFESGIPPNGGTAVPTPAPQHMEDTHQGRSGGSMKSLRTDADYPEASLFGLAHHASQASDGRGLFYPGPVEHRGLGPRPVQSSIPHRDSSEHTGIFGRMTGGERSSTQYQRTLGTAEQDTSYQILHGMGHGEGGHQTQSPMNLASASEGANTEMIPFDKAISGNPNVLVDTSFRMRPGTHRAESVHQSFAHKDFPDDPFHHRDIDGDRPRPTRSEYEGWEEEASRFSDPNTLEAAASMIHMSRQKQSTWGRLGQWAPGSHPLDPRGSGHDDDDDMMT